MLSNIKERIPFFKSKTLEEYTQTILVPSFNMIDISNNADIVGLDIETYKRITLGKKNINSSDINYRIMKLINYINKVVFDEVFSQNVIKKIVFIANYGKFECRSKSFCGFVEYNHKKYKFALEIDVRNIIYAYEYLNEKERGSFKVDKDGIKIKYNYSNINKKHLSDKTHFKVYNKTNLEVYNNDKHQQFGQSFIQKYNYFELDDSKEKIVTEIDPKQNYTEKKYIWNCPNNTILKRKELKYHYPDNKLNNIEVCLIGKNIAPNSNKLPTKGIYYQLDNQLFQDYNNHKCDIDTLWDNAFIYQISK